MKTKSKIPSVDPWDAISYERLKTWFELPIPYCANESDIYVYVMIYSGHIFKMFKVDLGHYKTSAYNIIVKNITRIFKEGQPHLKLK